VAPLDDSQAISIGGLFEGVRDAAGVIGDPGAHVLGCWPQPDTPPTGAFSGGPPQRIEDAPEISLRSGAGVRKKKSSWPDVMLKKKPHRCPAGQCVNPLIQPTRIVA
jgi:hypothetical protein